MSLDLLQTLEGHTDRIWTLAWNPSGTILASSGGDKKIRLWSQQGSDLKWGLISILDNSHDKTIRRLSWSPCGQYIASASFDSTICVWKMNLDDKTWSNVYNLEGHESEVKSVAWSYDGNYLATCGRDKVVWIWERALPSSDASQDGDDEDSAKYWDCSDIKNDHTKDVKHVVWHPKFNILVSCSYDDSVKFFHKTDDDWKCYETLVSHTSTVWSADFSPTGEFLVTCSDDRTVKIWKNHAHDKLPEIEQNSWKCVSTIQGYHNRTIYDVSWCKLTDVIVSASGDNSLAFYRKSLTDDKIELFTCIDKFKGSHECDVNSVSWNPKTPGLLASGSDDRTIKLWNYSNSKNEGMTNIDKPLTIAEEIFKGLKETCITDIDRKMTYDQQNKEQNLDDSISLQITDFSILLNNVQSLQNLQNEFMVPDEELRSIEQVFDLKANVDQNPKPVELFNLKINEEDGVVDEFTIKIIGFNGEIRHRFRFIIDKSTFKLSMPRRSFKLLVIAKELILLEKTGEMFKVLPTGKCQFLLGHLFTFTDVKFVMSDDKIDDIRFVITSDRDEKIRISNYPETYRIERFCFGHKSFIRRLVVIDKERFISLDQDNSLILWNISNLGHLDNNKLLMPERMVSMSESVSKRLKT